MTTEQRNLIVKLARKHYEAVGCVFPEDDREMIEYLYESHHPDEQRCLYLAIQAFNIFCDGDMDVDEFYDWHGL